MATEIGSLGTGVSALQAERKALEVTGQNIANANTDGYTRQRIVMEGVGGSVVPAMYAKSDGVGAGVNATTVQRLQDGFLEQRANTENGSLSYLQTSQQTLSDIENSFGEPGDKGIQSMLSTYWNAWDDVANNPSDTGSRTALIGAGQSLATGLNDAATALNAQWTSSQQSLQSIAQQVNQTASNIATLNKAIIAANAAGNPPNDLMDQRDTLIRQLASVTGVTTKPNSNGSTDVLVNGQSLVSGDQARQIVVGGATALDQVATSPVTITWADTGMAVRPTSGQVGAFLDALNTTIPSYSSQLDTVAASLVSTVNTQQAAGYDLNGNPGGNFFDPTKTTAASITVSMTDPSLVAASATAPSGGQPSYDGSNAQTIANFAGTGADASYRKLIVGLGSQSQAVQQKANTQQAVVQHVTAARDSAAGVDLDQEQTNLISYQQAYNAAAKYVSVVDSVLDTLINRMLV